MPCREFDVFSSGGCLHLDHLLVKPDTVKFMQRTLGHLKKKDDMIFTIFLFLDLIVPQNVHF